MSKRVFVSLGSNIGDRKKYLNLARNEICLLRGTKILSLSSLMETSSVGIENNHKYVNQVLLIETDIDPNTLLVVFKQIERHLGRLERGRWGDREIDIDILIYEGTMVNKPNLYIPHKELSNRLFILKGCFEIDPDYVIEGHDMNIRELYLTNKSRLKHQEVRTLKSQFDMSS